MKTYNILLIVQYVCIYRVCMFVSTFSMNMEIGEYDDDDGAVYHDQMNILHK